MPTATAINVSVGTSVGRDVGVEEDVGKADGEEVGTGAAVGMVVGTTVGTSATVEGLIVGATVGAWIAEEQLVLANVSISAKEAKATNLKPLMIFFLVSSREGFAFQLITYRHDQYRDLIS